VSVIMPYKPRAEHKADLARRARPAIVTTGHRLSGM